MSSLAAGIRNVAGGCALAVLTALSTPGSAQEQTQQPAVTIVNPTAEGVTEQQLLQQEPRITGRISIPDSRAAVLIQPGGREWRAFHEIALRWIAAIAILGMLVILVAFYLTRGMVRLESGRSGRTIVRFNALRALRALDDGNLLHHSRPVRPQHHLRQEIADAADGP